jgi:hypothetical protein
MNKLLIIACVLAGLAGASLAATGDTTDERRTDTATYRLTEPGLQSGTAPATLSTEASPAVAIAVPGPLAELRARHLAAYENLSLALANSRDNAERASLELQAVELKTAQQREELQWLKADAESRGDAAYAARLDEALREAQPKAAPVATSFVPRDPATGRALSTEGGSK